MTATADRPSSVLPTATEMMEKLAAAEGKKASEALRLKAKAEAEHKALIEKFTTPSGLSDEEIKERALVIIQRAIQNGLTQVQFYRFPNTLCTDRGRAINQQERNFASTLTGVPKEIYEFWDRQMRPLGYKLQFQIVDFPGGVPGDVGITLKWG